MGLVLVTPPVTLPVSLALAKQYCRVDHDDEDDVIVLLIEQATDRAEQFTGRKFIDQTWDYYVDAFPSGAIILPLGPLIEVVTVAYRDSNGDEQTTTNYLVDVSSSVPRVTLPTGGSWPTPDAVANAVRIRFRVGYLDNNSPGLANVPAMIRAAILIDVVSYFENRQTIIIGQTATRIPEAWENLLRPYRLPLGMA